jgi:hypothetical protein
MPPSPTTVAKTEQRPARRPRRPSLIAVGGASAAAFAIVLALLIVQMRLGRDPLMGARSIAQAAPRRVLVRRVIVRRVVVEVIGGGRSSSPTSTGVVESSGAVSSVAPVAPAPAPPVTRTS